MADSTITGLTAASTIGGSEVLPVDQSGATVKVAVSDLTPGLADFVGDAGSPSTPAKGLVPAPTGGDAAAGKFLKADGTWSVPSGASGTTVAHTFSGRLTLTSGAPVTTTDVTGATTIYFTPYKGAQIGLYNGSSWDVISFSETSIAIGTKTSGANYDVFAYSNSGTLTLEFSSAWTSDTARNDALALQDGIYVKSSDHTRRYLGTFRTTSTTATEDSQAKRFLWNRYNHVSRSMARQESAASWTYTTATWRQANGSTANQLSFVVGLVEDSVSATVMAGANNSGGSIAVSIGIGLNSTTSPTQAFQVFTVTGFSEACSVTVNVVPALGYNYLAWLEHSQASGTTTWNGVITGTFANTPGICGSLRG